jgi:protein gp37
MGKGSAIEWTDHTFNPWWGCRRVSPACDHCYADAFAHRLGMELWDNGKYRTFGAKHWSEPLAWNKAAALAGTRPRVFCASMADVFDKDAPAEERQRLWRLIEATPHLDWLLLTKRIGNAERMLPWGPYGDPWPNVWLGSTVVTQEEFDRDLPKLLTVAAAVRFLSCEPMLGPIEFGRHGSLRGLQWVICGGESGSKARRLELDWAMRLQQQCAARGIAFFMKQGSQANWDAFKDFDSFLPALRVREWPRSAHSIIAPRGADTSTPARRTDHV